MLLPNIKLEDNKYITNIYNTVTNENTSLEFEDLRKATDYVLEVKQEYYDFKFFTEIFNLNYEKYKILFEYNLNPSEELLNQLRFYEDYYERTLTKSGYYIRVFSKDDPNLWKELFGEPKKEVKLNRKYKTFNDFKNFKKYFLIS